MTRGSLTLGEIAGILGTEVKGDPKIQISGIANLKEAQQGQLSFLFSRRYRKHLAGTSASAVVIRAEDAGECPVSCLISDDPRLAWAMISKEFDLAREPEQGVHPSAVVSESASVGKGTSIAAHVVVEDGVTLGNGVVIGPGCVIGADSSIGDDTRLWANVTLYHGVSIGKRVIVHSGAVLGADGFGFAFDVKQARMQKISQVYGVKVGDDVEIGAGTTIDRGALNDTVIGQGVKLDNQVQVGHGATIGAHTVMSGCSAVAGSTRIGSYCLIGGGVGIVDNLEIADRVEITALSLVSQSISQAGRYSSGTGLQPSSEWRRNIVGFKRLGQLERRLKDLERQGPQAPGGATTEKDRDGYP